jgi:hypothetical protein
MHAHTQEKETNQLTQNFKITNLKDLENLHFFFVKQIIFYF